MWLIGSITKKLAHNAQPTKLHIISRQTQKSTKMDINQKSCVPNSHSIPNFIGYFIILWQYQQILFSFQVSIKWAIKAIGWGRERGKKRVDYNSIPCSYGMPFLLRNTTHQCYFTWLKCSTCFLFVFCVHQDQRDSNYINSDETRTTT